MIKTQMLSNISFLNNIRKDKLNKIVDYFYLKDYKKDEFVFYANSLGETMYIILEGLIEISIEYKDGRRKVLTILKEGDFFGESAAFTGGPRSASAKSLSNSKLVLLHKNDLLKLIKKYPEIAINLIQIISSRLIAADGQIEDLTFKNIQGRTANQLLLLANKHGIPTESGDKIQLSLTHSHLAEMIGSSRETITRVLNQFKKEDSIEIEEHHIIVKDKTKLLEWF